MKDAWSLYCLLLVQPLISMLVHRSNAWVHTLSCPTATHDLTPIHCSHTMSINSPFVTSQKSQKGSGAPVGFINLGSPMGPLTSKSAAQQTTLQQNVRLLGQPRYLTTGQKRDLVFDWKAWPRRGRRSLLILTRLFDPEYTEPLLTALLQPTQSEPTGNN